MKANLNSAFGQNGWFRVSTKEVKELFKPTFKPEWFTKMVLIIVTALFSPITLAGALYGFVKAYNKFLFPKDILPNFHPMQPITRVAMIAGAILIWGLLICIAFFIVSFIPVEWLMGGYIFAYLGVNLLFGAIVFSMFKRWKIGVNNALVDGEKYGSARSAREDELEQYKYKNGLFIGGEFQFDGKFHALSVASTRGGKGANLIVPNLLGKGSYKGSWVVTDVKGENAAITARYQRESGQNVVILNPWNLLNENLPESHSYNPLDILSNGDPLHLVDDCAMVSEMIVPIDRKDRDKFFTDNARAVITGLLLHMATKLPYEERNLKTLWQIVRYSGEQWANLLADMATNDDPINGEAVQQAAYEILKLSEAGDRTWGSIIAVALQNTNFINSFALQKATETGFDARDLANGNTTLYVIIPAEKLSSHARWLRLVMTTTMRAVIRKPNKKVTYVLDEFAALGYLPEVEVAMSTYSGYNVSIWTILQNLSQLKANYENTWENFISNSAIRHYFSVNDNFTAQYVSTAAGVSSNVVVQKSWLGIEKSEVNQRPLITPDELRRLSDDYIFTFIAGLPITKFKKNPYYEMDLKDEHGVNRYDANPYFKDESK